MMPIVQVEKRQLIDQFISRLQSVFSVDLLADLLSRLILALVVFSVVMLTWIIINRFVSHRLKRRVDSTTAAMLQTLTKTAFISLGLLAGLNAADASKVPVCTPAALSPSHYTQVASHRKMQAFLTDERHHELGS